MTYIIFIILTIWLAILTKTINKQAEVLRTLGKWNAMLEFCMKDSNLVINDREKGKYIPNPKAIDLFSND